MTMNVRPNQHVTGAEELARSHFMQVRLPTELYEWLRTSAFLTHRRMTTIVREVVAAYRMEVEAGRIVPEGGVREDGAHAKSVVQLNDETYEWLRTTAFYTRSSINALIIAALTRAQTTQTEETPGV